MRFGADQVCRARPRLSGGLVQTRCKTNGTARGASHATGQQDSSAEPARGHATTRNETVATGLLIPRSSVEPYSRCSDCQAGRLARAGARLGAQERSRYRGDAAHVLLAQLDGDPNQFRSIGLAGHGVTCPTPVSAKDDYSQRDAEVEEAATRADLQAARVRTCAHVRSGVGALAATERRVADLATEGHTNKDIAQLLYVTPKTIEVHLSSVYRKLAVRSRRELAGALQPA